MADINKNEVNIDLELDPVAEDLEAKPVRVLYMPLRDFSARVNQDDFQFRAGIRTLVDRNLAADLTRDPKNGYVIEQ